MSLNALLSILIPPQNPAEIPTLDDWINVERRVGRLPNDYRTYLERFGTGTIDRFLWVLNPVSPNPPSQLVPGKGTNPQCVKGIERRR